ncbi:hypothetical protein [Brevundimonas sp.]|uniref:hypothetical protein n=1 Tax=Brevundimonas sp. TaxID=1871086 RepID=UPI00289E0954|nr:hypothetical protein [Brevundimonas sp.]
MARSPAAEQLRQERETFDQARSQDRLWFGLRLAMGYVAIAIMVLVASVSLYVMLHPQRYGPAVLTLAAAALLVDMVSLAAAVFRLVLQQGSARALGPVTQVTSHPGRNGP